jgi:cytochrome c biogenesis protein CcmG, thiol:disulfide interchange protein DsbE
VPADARPRLPLRVIAASTVIALATAVVTYQVLAGGGDDGTPDQTVEMGLVPMDDARSADELAGVTFQDLGGTTTALGDLHGSPVLLNYFASWCVPCKTEMPALEEVHQELGDQVTFLGLAINDRPEDVRKTVADTGVTYRIGRDVDDRVFTATGALGPLPATVLLDDRDAVVEIHRGELTADDVRALLADSFGVEP